MDWHDWQDSSRCIILFKNLIFHVFFLLKQAHLTASPCGLRPEPFIDKIVDYSNPFSAENSVVLTRFEEYVNSSNINFWQVLENVTWVALVFVLIFLLILVVSLDKLLLVKSESLFQRFSSVVIMLIGTILQKGEFCRKYFNALIVCKHNI